MKFPQANIENSEQNAFVQDWLSQWCNLHIEDPEGGPGDSADDYDAFQSVIELIQGTYNYKDHEARKNAVATGGEVDVALHVMGRILEIVPAGHEIYNAFELAYAFLNATKQIAQES